MNRRLFSVVLASGLTGCSRAWRATETFRIGVVNEENENDREIRYQPLAEYFTGRLGKQAVIRRTADYAGVIEAMRSGHLELARFGPASYARAWMVTNGAVEPVCAEYDRHGGFGSQSVIVVKSESRYETIDDLRGRVMGWADPNSTTGFQAPTFYLRKEGRDPAAFFGKSLFCGGHESSILAVLNGTCDAAATWRENDERGNVQRMELKQMIPRGSTRIVWRAPMMAPSPWAYTSRLDPELKAKVTELLLNMPEYAPKVWFGLTDGQQGGFRKVTHADYADVVEMIQANEKERKAG